MTYSAPTVVRYGSVASLTATAIKCSPGADSIFGNDTERLYFLVGDGDGTWTAPDGGTLPGAPDVPEGCTATEDIIFTGGG